MEFKTSQGGETTLLFDDHEMAEIVRIAANAKSTNAQVIDLLARTRQANPLAGFTELIGLAFAGRSDGLVPQGRKQRAAAVPPDPVAMLAEDIRRRLAAITSVAVGQTSASMQTEAMLLNALATCLQTQMLREMLERLDKSVAVSGATAPMIVKEGFQQHG